MIEFNESSRSSLAERLEAARGLAPLLYPWHDAAEVCRASGRRTLPLVAYGSLISIESARRTLKRTDLDARVPVIAHGVRRTFDYPMPASSISRWNRKRDDDEAEPSEAAALNVYVTWEAADRFNGTLIEVDFDDLAAFRAREEGYDLFLVPISRWNEDEGNGFESDERSGDDLTPSALFVLSDLREHPRRNTLLPHPEYTDLCRDACRRISDAFATDFDVTTYLADGTTTLETYLRTRLA